MHTFIDLFAGIGGFRLPLEKLGFKCIGFSEIDKKAIDVYKSNFNTKSEIELGDITKLSEIPYADIITGGVPCQSWSVAGSKKGFGDDRGKLWFDTIQAVKISKPKAFIFENVKGLANPKHMKSLIYIKNEFKKLGYKVSSKVLNAYDYGLPQNRDRIFIVGIREDIKRSFSFPEPLNIKPKLYDILDNININPSHLKKKELRPQDIFGKKIPTSRNRFQKINYLNDFFTFCDTRAGHSTIHSWDLISTNSKEKLICETLLKERRRKIYGNYDGNPLSLGDLKRLIPSARLCDLKKLCEKNILTKKGNKFDFVNTKNSIGLNKIHRIFLPQSDIFPTITATGNNDYVATTTISQNKVLNYKKSFIEDIYNKGHFRSITAREAARLQGFPESFKIHENSRVSLKQFGNAVPINIVSSIASEILNVIKD